MSIGLVFSSVVLIISVLVSAVKLFDWLSYSDPRSIMRMVRLSSLLVAGISVPGLAALLAWQEWIWAMLLGAAMLLGLVLVNWRTLLPRTAFRPLWVDEPVPAAAQRYHGHSIEGPDTELARRAAIVLQDYLALAQREERIGRVLDDQGVDEAGPTTDGGTMRADEALSVLGLHAEATASEIRDAHRRLMQLVHPDRGGTNYLAIKINRAKDVLLARTRGKPSNGKAANGRVAAAGVPPGQSRGPRGARATRAGGQGGQPDDVQRDTAAKSQR